MNTNDPFGKVIWQAQQAIDDSDFNKLKDLIVENLWLKNPLEDTGGSLLHYAVTNRNPGAVEFLISEGLDVNMKDLESVNTPLLIAVEEEDAEITELLLQLGADVNCRNPNGCTPLHLAAKSGNTEIAKILIFYEADVNARDIFDGWSPLDYALAEERSGVADMLRRSGARQFGKGTDK